MSTASQIQEKEKKFGDDAGLLHQVALSLRAVCKDETEARVVVTRLAHDRPFLTKVVTLALGKPKRSRFSKGLVDSDLLEPVTTVSVGAVKAFSAREKFQISTQDGVKIGGLGDNFKKHFLAGTGKIELDVPAQKLRVHKLRRNLFDRPILVELGGELVVETYLATMFARMKKQGMGQAGVLIVDGKANIFYIKDDKGVLWAVLCRWDADNGAWYVEAYPVTSPYDWGAGSQVLSR